MKNIFLIYFLLIFGLTMKAQKVKVIDETTSKPLIGVVLISESPQASVVTDVNGKAEISNFIESDRIEIQAIGYEKKVMSYDEIKTSDFIIKMQITNWNLDEVVISATRWKESSGNIPNKITTISSKEVALQNPQTAADLLSISGKVFVQKSQQGGGSPMIRGFATNRLVYTIDGVRMNTAIFRGGNLQNVISLDPFATESTEVLFGPGSVIYGSDAIGGVMSFQTLTPQLSDSNKILFSGKAVSRYSSANNEKTGHFDVNLGWKKWAVVTSFSAWDFDHLRQGSNGPNDYLKGVYPEREDNMDRVITQNDPLLQIPSAYSQVNVMQKIRFKPSEKWDFQYGFHYSETSPYGRYDRHNRFRDDTIRYAEWNYGPQKWMMNNLNISNQSKNLIYDQMTLRLAQQFFEESRIDRTFNNNLRNSRIENVDAYSANLDFTKSTGKKNSLFYGFEYVLNEVTSEGFSTDITNGDKQKSDARYPNSLWHSIAAYVNNEFRVSEKFTLHSGIRYNQFILNADFSNNQDFFQFPFSKANINNGALTGSIGSVYRPSKKWIIRANFGTAFRAPNVDDIGKVFDSEPGSVVVPNPDLEAEYAYNFDLGIAKVFGDIIKIDLTAYYTILQNAMVRRDFQLNGQDSIVYDGQISKVQSIQNAAFANVYGVQAGIEVKLIKGFKFLSDINYQLGEEELDNGNKSASRHAAPFFGVSRIRYKMNDFTLELNTIYQGERSHENLAVSEQGKDEIYAKDKNGNNYSPAWYTLNLKAMYQLSSTFSTSLGLENITDQRYRPYSSGLSGAGRNFILSIRAEF